MNTTSLRKAIRLNSLYQTLKGIYQDADFERCNRSYLRLAKKNGILAPKDHELKLRLRERIGQRTGLSWPKSLGEMHIFLPFSITNWESILPRAFSTFGRVSSFNWREYGYDDRRDGWLEIRDKMNEQMLRVFHKAYSIQPVDAVCGYLSGFLISSNVLAEMKDSGAAIFNFCWDDILNFPGKKLGGRYASPAAIAEAVDLNLTNSPASVIKYMIHGGLAQFFPEAAHPELHRPYSSEFQYDVTFVGANYGLRPRFIKQLKRMGIAVECFGQGWPNGILTDIEMVRMYSKSRINLGFSGVGYSRKLRCLKGRDFEIPMSGGLYLTQWNPDLELVFNIGREILTYRSVRECADLIGDILEHPEEAEKIRLAGRARCLADHSYEARWRKVFMLAGILKGDLYER